MLSLAPVHSLSSYSAHASALTHVFWTTSYFSSPSDTPEGESCGLVKNLALLTHVTSDDDETPVSRFCYNLGVEDMELISGDEWEEQGRYLVLINGKLLGVHRHPQQFTVKFRQLRRMGQIPTFVSIYENEQHRTVYVATDGGRVCRPLIIVKKGVPLVTAEHLDELRSGIRTFDDFLSDGLIEYLDVNEENNALMALREADMTSTSTHLEIDPMTILGVVAGLIPYPHHNQSPRNTVRICHNTVHISLSCCACVDQNAHFQCCCSLLSASVVQYQVSGIFTQALLTQPCVLHSLRLQLSSIPLFLCFRSVRHGQASDGQHRIQSVPSHRHTHVSAHLSTTPTSQDTYHRDGRSREAARRPSFHHRCDVV